MPAPDAIDALRGDPLRRQSTAEQVAALLRDEILAGHLAPGTPLPEVALAEKVAVSRHSLREALRLLVADGLVTHEMHRGAVVTEQTPEDLADIHRARVALELAAVAALPDAGEGQLQRLADPVSAMADAIAAGDGRAAMEADLAFHRSFVALLGSARIDEFYAGLQRELRLGLATLDRTAPQPGKAAEHRRLVDLATARDVRGLRAAVAAHLAATEAELLRTTRR